MAVCASGTPEFGRSPVATMTQVPIPRPSGPDWLAVTDHLLPVDEVIGWTVQPACGALATFCGTVRDHSEGHAGVTSLEYEAYLEHVESRLGQVAAAARRRWPVIGRLALLHRIGLLQVGETSVVVAVSTPHRAEAFEAARFCIDTIKETVPIWKRETWDQGSDWVRCNEPPNWVVAGEGTGVPEHTDEHHAHRLPPSVRGNR
jgi:molybdopterin synthase catalytic subunit